MFVVAVIIMVAIDLTMRRTMVGKAMRAVAHDRRVASLMGINVTAFMVGAFFLSSALAGLSGALIAPIASASLYVGLGIALKGFSGAIVGGLSNPRGCVLGRVRPRRSRIPGQPMAGAMAGDRRVPPRNPGPGASAAWPARTTHCGEGMMRAPHLLMVAAVAGAAAFLASLIDNDYYLRILFMMGVYYLCAAGMNVLVGYAGQKSLGQAGLFAAGAYTAALLTTSLDLNPWLALGAAAIAAAACGVLIAWPSLRVRGPYLAMVTLAFGIVVEKLVSEWTEVFGGAEGIYGIKSLALFGTPFGMLQWVWFVIALGVVTHLLLRNLLSGRFGRAFLSLQADEIAAESVGVSVYRYKILAFVIAAVTCGVAGAIVAQQNQYLNSDFISFNLSIFILLLVLFGGAGNQYGPLVGAILLTLIDAQLAKWPSIQHFVYGALLLFSLYLMPNGVAGLIKQLLGGRGTLPWLVRSRSPSRRQILRRSATRGIRCST